MISLSYYSLPDQRNRIWRASPDLFAPKQRLKSSRVAWVSSHSRPVKRTAKLRAGLLFRMRGLGSSSSTIWAGTPSGLFGKRIHAVALDKAMIRIITLREIVFRARNEPAARRLAALLGAPGAPLRRPDPAVSTRQLNTKCRFPILLGFPRKNPRRSKPFAEPIGDGQETCARPGLPERALPLATARRRKIKLICFVYQLGHPPQLFFVTWRNPHPQSEPGEILLQVFTSLRSECCSLRVHVSALQALLVKVSWSKAQAESSRRTW